MLFDVATRLLRRLGPEESHRATVAALKFWPYRAAAPDHPSLGVSAFGLNFDNPVGLAAGFDKNAEVFRPLLALGFGFVEVGTLTPRPQSGNPGPRVFRLAEDKAVINRYGFNNAGHAPALRRLNGPRRGIVGVNIGANKDSVDRVADYVAGVVAFSPVADYLSINISSPNTPGLRDLQEPAALAELLARVMEARAAASTPRPVLLKVAPDLTLRQLDDIVRVARDAQIDGMIVSNTTISRPPKLSSPLASEAGGLSGAPLFELSTRMLAHTYLRVEGQFPLIGAGGIDNFGHTLAKIEAGATLIQLYSALVYRGPSLIARIKRGLLGAIARDGVPLASRVGRRATEFAT